MKGLVILCLVLALLILPLISCGASTEELDFAHALGYSEGYSDGRSDGYAQRSQEMEYAYEQGYNKGWADSVRVNR